VGLVACCFGASQSAHFETRGEGVLCSRLRTGWRVNTQAYNSANRFFCKTGEASGAQNLTSSRAELREIFHLVRGSPGKRRSWSDPRPSDAYGCRSLRIIIALLLFLLPGPVCAGSSGQFQVNGPTPSPSNPVFALPRGSVMHYADPSGSDRNDGLAPKTGGGHGPWLTQNHNMKCGEVILYAPGSYPQQGPSGKVSNCPSTSGGIDGTGGIWFATLLCAGPSVGDCFVTTKTHTKDVTVAFFFNSSNWAVEGFYVNTGLATGKGGVAQGRAYEMNANANIILHHFAVINSISANNLQAIDTNDNGSTTNNGVDYTSAVGVIAQNSAQDGICLGAIDIVSPGVFDTTAGTHFYISGNFAYAGVNGINPGCTDVEGFLFDSPGNHNNNSQHILSNNIAFSNWRMGFQALQSKTETTIEKIYNNTFFHNNLNTHGDNYDAEIHVQTFGAPISLNLTINDNIAFQPLAVSPGGAAPVGAMGICCKATGSNVNVGGAGKENIFRANQSFCKLAFCNPTFDVASNGTLAELGTNLYPGTRATGPGFANTTDLLANQVGVPNCSGFETTTMCMGYNPVTKTLTTPSVISDLIPSASGTAGKGYQFPSITCVTTGPIASDYPTYLKGIVYLHWNAGTSQITENAGLVTKPCGL
jgi:hypothetical protein